MTIVPLFLLALLSVTPSYSLLNSIQGTISLSPTSSCQDIFITDDGSTLACTHYPDQTIDLYTNTGVGFELNQTIPLTFTPNNFKMNLDGSKIYLTGSTKFCILRKASNSTYETIIEVTYASFPLDSCISEDEAILIVSFLDGSLTIFKKNNTNYIIQQIINDSPSPRIGIKLSEDKN